LNKYKNLTTLDAAINYKIFGVPTFGFWVEKWTVQRKHETSVEAAELKFLRSLAVYIIWRMDQMKTLGSN
jgi:hypothetical protein